MDEKVYDLSLEDIRPLIDLPAEYELVRADSNGNGTGVIVKLVKRS